MDRYVLTGKLMDDIVRNNLGAATVAFVVKEAESDVVEIGAEFLHSYHGSCYGQI